MKTIWLSLILGCIGVSSSANSVTSIRMSESDSLRVFAAFSRLGNVRTSADPSDRSIFVQALKFQTAEQALEISCVQRSNSDSIIGAACTAQLDPEKSDVNKTEIKVLEKFGALLYIVKINRSEDAEPIAINVVGNGAELPLMTPLVAQEQTELSLPDGSKVNRPRFELKCSLKSVPPRVEYGCEFKVYK